MATIGTNSLIKKDKIQTDRIENAHKNKWIDNLLGKLSLEQKVGQLIVAAFYGPVITPDVIELITKYHIGGLRITQKFMPGMYVHRTGQERPQFLLRSDKNPDSKTLDRPPEIGPINCTSKEYAETLNKLRDIAMDRPCSVPLHFTIDLEGEGSDLFFGQRLYPYPMGLAATGQPEMAYKVARCVGLQSRAVGVNMIHSPVLDVNTNPNNPEIGPRAYGDNPDDVVKYALKTLRGFQETGIIATAKHFPGRGESEQDAHFSLPVINLNKNILMDFHIKPYRELIKAGLPAIMAAFTAYPALSGQEIPAAASGEIITNILREELGFDGVVTTDAIQMAGFLIKYEIADAVLHALQAGCDLILCRYMTPQRKYIIEKIIDAVKTGSYKESQLDESVRRILSMRWDMGLVENGGKIDPSKAADLFNNEFIKTTAREAAEKSTLLLRDKKRQIPIAKDKKILLIEQIHHFHSLINNTYSHPGMLWLEMCKHSENVSVVLVNERITENDKKAVFNRLTHEQYDIIVSTSYYNYRTNGCMIDFINEITKKFDKPVIISNTPFTKFGVPQDIDTALVSFCPSGKENIEAAVKVLFGKLEPSAKLSVKLS